MFGVDIILDIELNVFLLEVNARPFMKAVNRVHSLVLPGVTNAFLETSIFLFDHRD
jgi:glutathione synthase/RimK-type ligase-like ATP-grasp enzyme